MTTRKERLAEYIKELKTKPKFIQLNYLKGIHKHEGAKCKDMKRLDKYDNVIPIDINKQDIVCGKMTFAKSGKTLYFGKAQVKKTWINKETDEMSLIIPLNKNSDLFITPSKLSNLELYVWSNTEYMDDIEDIDYDESY